MVYCVACGTANDDGARFCTKCGEELFIPEDIITEALEVEVVPTEDIIYEEVVVEPKKRGRKPKTKTPNELKSDEDITQELPIVIEEEIVESNDDNNELKFDELKFDELKFEELKFEELKFEEREPRKAEPEALEWNSSSPTQNRYVPPVIPRAYTSSNDTYRSTPQGSNSNYDRTVVEANSQRIISDKKTKPISTGAYFWLKVLYGIPGVGLIMLIILSIAPANLNIKRFTRASLIYRIICYSVLLIMTLILVIVWQHFDWAWCNDFRVYRNWYPNWSLKIW